MISIADNLLFKSGSYEVGDKAKSVLAKVAKVINSKPDFECMVEGHADNIPIKSTVLVDNWDLSVKTMLLLLFMYYKRFRCKSKTINTSR